MDDNAENKEDEIAKYKEKSKTEVPKDNKADNKRQQSKPNTKTLVEKVKIDETGMTAKEKKKAKEIKRKLIEFIRKAQKGKAGRKKYEHVLKEFFNSLDKDINLKTVTIRKFIPGSKNSLGQYDKGDVSLSVSKITPDSGPIQTFMHELIHHTEYIHDNPKLNSPIGKTWLYKSITDYLSDSDTARSPRWKGILYRISDNIPKKNKSGHFHYLSDYLADFYLGEDSDYDLDAQMERQSKEIGNPPKEENE